MELIFVQVKFMTKLVSQKLFTPLLVISNFETRDRNSIFDMFEVLR
eukprot:UN11397